MFAHFRSRCLRARLFSFVARVNFYKFIDAHVDGPLVLTLQNGVGNRGNVQTDGTNRIIVPWNNVIDSVRITVGINHANYWNRELVCFSNRNALVLHVDHKHRIGEPTHLFNSPETTLELRHQTAFL